MRIGVFDSGIGGITVLTELRARFKGVDFVYLGDTAHHPYGAKSPAQIRQLSADCARLLKSKSVDCVVVACNTASSLALDAIREVMGKTPVFGVVQPGVEAALEALAQVRTAPLKAGELEDEMDIMAPILVLATRATVRSGAYGRHLREVLELSLVPGKVPCPVVEQPCPLLAPMIEEGWVDHPILHQTISEYVTPHFRVQAPGVALLACTHYPWIHAAFERALPGWAVVNSAQAVSSALERSEFWKNRPKEISSGRPGAVEWIFTDPEAVPAFARRLIQESQAKP